MSSFVDDLLDMVRVEHVDEFHKLAAKYPELQLKNKSVPNNQDLVTLLMHDREHGLVGRMWDKFDEHEKTRQELDRIRGSVDGMIMAAEQECKDRIEEYQKNIDSMQQLVQKEFEHRNHIWGLVCQVMEDFIGKLDPLIKTEKAREDIQFIVANTLKEGIRNALNI